MNTYKGQLLDEHKKIIGPQRQEDNNKSTNIETQSGTQQQVPGLAFEARHGRCIFSGFVHGKQDIRFST
jgi:hypothetical protein